MANTRSGGSQKDGESGSLRRGSSAKAKDSKSSTTSGSSVNGSLRSKAAKSNARETRSSALSAREAVDSPNLRRSSRETPMKKVKLPTPNSRKPSIPSPKKSTRPGRAIQDSLDKKKLKVVEAAHQSPTRKSKRIKKNASTSSALKDSARMSSSVATPKKNGNKQVAGESQKKSGSDRNQSSSGSSKKRKRLDAKSYRALFKPRSEGDKSSVVVASGKIDEESASKGLVVDTDIDVVDGEKCDALKENENQRHSNDALDGVLEGSTSSLGEASKVMLEMDGMRNLVNLEPEHDPPASIAEAQPHQSTSMPSQDIIVEGCNVLETREQSACLANGTCPIASPSRTRSPINGVEAKKEHEDSECMGIPEEHSTTGHLDLPITEKTDGGDNLCVICNNPGILKCCDGKGCKRRYHLSCLDPPLQPVFPGIWLCISCVKKRIQFGVYSVTEGVESVWDVKEGMQNGKQYFVKYKSLAHVHNRWIPESEVLNDVPGGPDLVSKFNKKNHKEKTIKWKQEWAEPHRILKKRLLMSQKEADEFFNALDGNFSYCNIEWLVKWRELGYEHATWEFGTAPFLCTAEGMRLIKGYGNRYEGARKASDPTETRKVKQNPFHKLQRLPDGCLPGLDNDHLSSVNQLREFWHKSRNAVFVDDQERVIKTILFMMSLLPDVSQPFLVVSTSASLSLWETKFNRLAPSINVVVYNGDKDARKLIKDLEFYEEGGCLMLQVLLSHPEAILEDIETIECIGWEAVVVDECQNSRVSKCLEQFRRLSADFRLLLLSSPLKDNLPEYINLLSFLESGEIDTSSSGSNIDSTDSVGALAMLKSKLTSYVAYERKPDSSKFLEYWVPARLSYVQLERYCATLLSNSSALRSCSRVDHVGILRDILISLHKCCDHPYLVDACLQSSLVKNHPITEILNIGVRASGKLLLLDKMLHEIRNHGLRVLILFQSGGAGKNPIGDILDDFVRQRYGPDSYERVERGLLMSKKQAAMNTFNDKTKGRFVFLIENRACLPSIKLSSVDAVIIYDSDWNPLNDLRALQKISIDSQSQRVTIFRLYSSCTVEEKVLILAKQDMILDSNFRSMIPSVSHSLLSWGAQYLFSRFDEIQQGKDPSEGSDADRQFLDKVVSEFLTKLSTKSEVCTERNSSAISKAQLSGTSYSRNIVLVGEKEGISSLDFDPPAFWLSLLDGRCPQWRYISESSQRSRRKVQNMEEPAKFPAGDDDEVRRKRRKVDETISSISPQSLLDKRKEISGSKDDVLPEISTPSSSSQQVLDETWQELGEEKLRNTQKNLHAQLRPEMSKLCEILGLPENVKCMTELLLEYIMNNHQVTQEPKVILQAFSISLCWRAASILKHKVDRRESLAVAEKYLNYECGEELTGFVYDKLRILKKKFSLQGGAPSNQCQPNPVNNNQSPHGKESPINASVDGTISKQLSTVHSKLRNGGPQEDPSGHFGAERLISEEQELLSVPESGGEQHLSRDELLNKIIEKKIDLVEKVFSLREKDILDQQQQVISRFEVDREKVETKLNEVRDLVLGHAHRSNNGPKDRDELMELLNKWFSMITFAFQEHMKSQNKKLGALQSATWAKEHEMKDRFLQEAKSGQLDESFDRTIPLPDCGFVMEKFDFQEQYGASNVLENSAMDSGPSLDKGSRTSDNSVIAPSMVEFTLVRNATPSQAITTEAVSNEPGEVLVDSEAVTASAAVDAQDNRSPNSSDGVSLHREVPLAPHHSSMSCPNDASNNQEPSVSEQRTTEGGGRENAPGFSPSQGGAFSGQHVGDVTTEVNANNSDIVTADALPHFEPPVCTAPCSQAALPVSSEIGTQTRDVIISSAQQVIAPSQQIPAEAEAADMLGVVAGQPPQSEMQPSMSMSTVPPETARLEDHSQGGHQSERTHGAAQFPQPLLLVPLVFPHPLDDEPLKNELHKLRLHGDLLTKSHEQKKLQLQAECEQEIEKIRRKYGSLLQEEDSNFFRHKMMINDVYEKVLINQSLAEGFRVNFIGPAQGKTQGPLVQQPPQASQQLTPRSSSVLATSSPTLSAPAVRPPTPTPLVSLRPLLQPSQVVRPSQSILPSNPVRATGSPFSQLLPPRGNYHVRNDQPRAPAPHLQRSRVPPPFMPSGNLTQNSAIAATQQQLPARLGVASSSRTQVLPVLPVTLSPSSSNAVPVSRGTPVSRDVPLGSGQVGGCVTNMQQIESESASLDAWLTSSLGLRDPPSMVCQRREAGGDVVCISDDE